MSFKKTPLGSAIERAIITCMAAAGLVRGAELSDRMEQRGTYHIVCIGADGQEKWRDTAPNLVFNPGKVEILDKFWQGSTYTASHSMGLVDGAVAPTFNAADTMASHAGWTENVTYSNSTRVAISWNAASASGGGSGSAGTGTKVTTVTSFNVNGSATIAGCFISTNNTKSGTTGICISAGAFTGGNKVLQSGDTLQVTYTSQN